MGWRVQVTNVPRRLSLVESVVAYRGGWVLEGDFHVLKDRPMGIRPLYVRRDDQVVGLAHLVTLALRVLTLFEVLVRRGQEQSGKKLPGLYPGQESRTTEVRRDRGCWRRSRWRGSRRRRWTMVRRALASLSLPELVHRVLASLGISEAIYNRILVSSN